MFSDAVQFCKGRYTKTSSWLCNYDCDWTNFSGHYIFRDQYCQCQLVLWNAWTKLYKIWWGRWTIVGARQRCCRFPIMLLRKPGRFNASSATVLHVSYRPKIAGGWAKCFSEFYPFILRSNFWWTFDGAYSIVWDLEVRCQKAQR